jgi:protein-L-isoaspartate(D-aspartate) O-methyltransferase
MRVRIALPIVLLLAAGACGPDRVPPETPAAESTAAEPAATESGAPAAGDSWSVLREEMVEKVRTMQARTIGRPDARVLEVMGRVERHRFVPPDAVRWAYRDTALHIGEGQTISAPHMVGLMTQMLELTGKEKVLEIGTGSGYQAAVLSELVPKVWSIEILESLADSARERLARLGYTNVDVYCGDGYRGWPDAAVPPFDAIIVTAAPEEIPEKLVRQLAPGGRMVVPVGPRDGYQRLIRIRKAEDGTVTRETGIPVAFVPMVHAPGEDR